MSQLNTGREVFIDRPSEFGAFRSLLDNPGSKAWILNIYGAGGTGKTWLLEKFRQIVLDEYRNILVTPRFVDFYFTPNQHEFGVLRNIADQLGANSFESFHEALARHEARLVTPIPPSPEEQQGLMKDIYDRFADCYQVLANQQRIILLMDTAEEAGEAVIQLENLLLPRIKGNTILVVAGRTPLSLGKPDEVISLPLQEFALDESVEYFRKHGFEPEDLPDEAIRAIWQRTSGRPILMALAADWLERHPAEKLLALPANEFVPLFITLVCDLGQLENLAILFMAHAWRRFNGEFLAHLSGQSIEVCTETIQRLHKLSFIKYRSPQMAMVESCLLHDEMRDLVRRHLWPNADRLGIQAREVSGQLVSYYGQLISHCHDRRERQSLVSEQLYYQLDCDLDVGFAAYRHMFEERLQAYDVAFCEAVNVEVERYRQVLSDSCGYELDFRRGWVALRREHHAQAIALWEALVSEANVANALKARVLTYLVEAYADNGEFQMAERSGHRAEVLYKVMEGSAVTPAQSRGIAQEKGLLYNNLGYMCRKQDQWKEAIHHYERALKAGGPPWQEARIRNNLGFAHQLFGRSEMAFSLCETALRIRKQLGIPYELGLSYNTLGILYVDALRIPEAERSFQEAMIAFAESHSERGRALVCTALGRLHRQRGWYQEHVVEKDQSFDREREDYCKALEYLQEAAEICTRVGNEAGLSEALQELGCTYRERRELDKAVKFLNNALKVAASKGMPRREADILGGLGITYWRDGNLAEAKKHAQQAVTKAQADRLTHQLYKAKWTLGDIIFAQGQLEHAFHEYAEACINITKPDPAAIGHESARKKLYYEDLVKHVEEQIMQIREYDQVKSACQVLVRKWQEASLADEFPGFIERIQAFSTRYDLLEEKEGSAADVK